MGCRGDITTLSVISALLIPLFTYLVKLQQNTCVYQAATIAQATPRATPAGRADGVLKLQRVHVEQQLFDGMRIQQQLSGEMSKVYYSAEIKSASSCVRDDDSYTCSAATTEMLRHL